MPRQVPKGVGESPGRSSCFMRACFPAVLMTGEPRRLRGQLTLPSWGRDQRARECVSSHHQDRPQRRQPLSRSSQSRRIELCSRRRAELIPRGCPTLVVLGCLCSAWRRRAAVSGLHRSSPPPRPVLQGEARLTLCFESGGRRSPQPWRVGRLREAASPAGRLRALGKKQETQKSKITAPCV